MTKADLTEILYDRIECTKREATSFVDVIFETMKEHLADGETLKISGFGTFVVREKDSRVGRNPQTGDAITIKARRVVTFRPSPLLKNALND